MFTFDTINRTWKSYVLNRILQSSILMSIMPPHTHDYRLFTTLRLFSLSWCQLGCA